MKKLFLGIAPLMLASGGPAVAQSNAWSISEVSGTVRIIEDGRTRAATRGALLASGSAIATAAQGRAVLVRGREFVIVSPNSQIRIPEPALAQRASQTGQARGGVMQWLSDWGTALFRIERRETPHFGVQTPYLAAVVKGTTFTVTVGPAGASVQVTEGAVEVSTPDGGAVELIRPGMIASVDADDLYQLNIDRETSRSIRSPSAPPAGVVTAAAAPASNTPYVGPSIPAATLAVAVAEDPVLLSETTDGLIEGRAGFDLEDEEASFELAMADVADAVHRVAVDDGGEVPPPIDDDDEAPPPPTDDDDEVPPPPPVDDDDEVPPPPPPPVDDDDEVPPPPPVDDDDEVPPPPPVDDDDDEVPPPPPVDDDDDEVPPPPPVDDDDDDEVPPPPVDDDGNNGHGNDDDGDDDGNPGNGGGRGDDDDDGNNGHGNDDDGDDDGNPGNSGGRGDDDDDGRNPGNGGGRGRDGG